MSHTEDSDFNYSNISGEHDKYLKKVRLTTNKKLNDEQKTPVNLNFD